MTDGKAITLHRYNGKQYRLVQFNNAGFLGEFVQVSAVGFSFQSYSSPDKLSFLEKKKRKSSGHSKDDGEYLRYYETKNNFHKQNVGSVGAWHRTIITETLLHIDKMSPAN